MVLSCQKVAETIADVISWRPVLEPVLKTFEPVLTAQEELVEELAGSIKASGLSLPEYSAARAGQGAFMLAGADLSGAAAPIREAAAKLLPLLGKFEAVEPHLPALEGFFLREAAHIKAPDQDSPDEGAAAAELAGKDKREALAEAMISGDHNAIARMAEDNGLEPPVLEFASGFIVSAVLKALLAQGVTEGEEPWNQDNLWQHGHCPVCGALPSIGWLEKPAIDDKNAFLAGGGGKKHLHCGQCGANWKFRRGACPSCGDDNNGTIEILRESGFSHGERLDWCTKCKTYCPTVDMREREFPANLEAAALGMMHLDIIAARRELRPLRPSFWNIF